MNPEAPRQCVTFTSRRHVSTRDRRRRSTGNANGNINGPRRALCAISGMQCQCQLRCARVQASALVRRGNCQHHTVRAAAVHCRPAEWGREFLSQQTACMRMHAAVPPRPGARPDPAECTRDMGEHCISIAIDSSQSQSRQAHSHWQLA